MNRSGDLEGGLSLSCTPCTEDFTANPTTASFRLRTFQSYPSSPGPASGWDLLCLSGEPGALSCFLVKQGDVDETEEFPLEIGDSRSVQIYGKVQHNSSLSLLPLGFNLSLCSQFSG